MKYNGKQRPNEGNRETYCAYYNKKCTEKGKGSDKIKVSSIFLSQNSLKQFSQNSLFLMDI